MARPTELDIPEGHMAPLLERIHPEPIIIGEKANTPFNESLQEVLHIRKSMEGSFLADRLTQLRSRLYEAQPGEEAVQWSYDPQQARRVIREDPRALGEEFEERTRECSDIIENGCTLLDFITRARTQNTAERPPSAEDPAWLVTVSGEDGLAQELLKRARAGANHGRSTKSPEVSGCAHPLWLQTMNRYSVRGSATYPAIATGPVLGGLSSGEFSDWRQDYVASFIYGFYFEYNPDGLGGSRRNHFIRDLTFLWDLPGLPAELRARRTHQLADLAFLDEKRVSEATLRTVPTTGSKAWVFKDRDHWRDFKACDSGMFGHYLSAVPGVAGRDDMMMTGLVQDWVDIGPDLRNGECAQSVLTLTRGSVSTASLVECYKRTVWLLNAMLTPEAEVKPERFSLLVIMLTVNLWQAFNHRHDSWRYYALAAEACALLQGHELYKACQLADCYSTEFEPTVPTNPARVTVPRRPLAYTVTVAGKQHSGTLELHSTLVDAVEKDFIPRETVEYYAVIPRLLFLRELTPAEFITHMDQHNCEQHAIMMDAAFRRDFDKESTTARLLLVMEQWWSGVNLAIGIGSLIEAQPGRTANDRMYEEQ